MKKIELYKTKSQIILSWTTMKKISIACLLFSCAQLFYAGCRSMPPGPDRDIIDEAKNGNLAAVQTALATGANINARDEDGVTPLIAASMMNRPAVVKLLLEKGADVNAKDNRRLTASQWASYPSTAGDKREIVRLLEAAASSPAKGPIQPTPPAMPTELIGSWENVQRDGKVEVWNLSIGSEAAKLSGEWITYADKSRTKINNAVKGTTSVLDQKKRIYVWSTESVFDAERGKWGGLPQGMQSFGFYKYKIRGKQLTRIFDFSPDQEFNPAKNKNLEISTFKKSEN